MTLQYFRHLHYTFSKTHDLFHLVKLQGYIDETHHLVAEHFLIHQTDVAAYAAEFFQPLNAGMNGGWRKCNAPRQFDVADGTILLNEGEYRLVDFINLY